MAVGMVVAVGGLVVAVGSMTAAVSVERPLQPTRAKAMSRVNLKIQRRIRPPQHGG
jgi:hypothetical protein